MSQKRNQGAAMTKCLPYSQERTFRDCRLASASCQFLPSIFAHTSPCTYPIAPQRKKGALVWRGATRRDRRQSKTLTHARVGVGELETAIHTCARIGANPDRPPRDHRSLVMQLVTRQARRPVAVVNVPFAVRTEEGGCKARAHELFLDR
jgi:hypothetical protein